MTVTTGMTIEEFLARDWPRGTQLIAGEVVVNEPALPHQLALGRLHALLLAWTDAEPRRGLTGISVDLRIENQLYAPDVWWVPENRLPSADATALDGLPDLVIEVRSPSTWRYDIGIKKATYEKSGVAELWLVDTNSRSVLVFRRSGPDTGYDAGTEVGGDELLTSPLLPGFEVAVARIFDR